jgi:hypothetical protein
MRTSPEVVVIHSLRTQQRAYVFSATSVEVPASAGEPEELY